jgi:hypothetical protein
MYHNNLQNNYPKTPTLLVSPDQPPEGDTDRLPRPRPRPWPACRRRHGWRGTTTRKQRRLFRAQGIPDLALGCGHVLLDGLLCVGRVVLSFLVFFLDRLDEESRPGFSGGGVWGVDEGGWGWNAVLCCGTKGELASDLRM